MDGVVVVAIAATLIAAIVLCGAVHVWYALGLSRVFAAHGAEPWRAWVPLVNEAELFRLGRLDPVRAVLLVVPFVSIYGLVLKGTAAHRLGQRAGRGAGTTALAVLLPPVWATVLAAAEKKTADATPSTVVEPVAEAPASDGPIAAVPGLPAVASAVPTSSSPANDPARPAGAASPGRRRASAAPVEPAVAPELPGPVEIAPAAVAPSPDLGVSLPPIAAPAPSSPGAPSGLPASAPEAGPALAAAPALAPAPAPALAPAPAPAGDSASVVAASVPASEPAAPSSAGAAALAGITARGESSAAVPHPADVVSEVTDATGASERDDHGPAVGAAPVEEATQIARPRSRRRGEWALLLPDGTTEALTGRTVVLGRKPTAADGVTQCVTVADDTRTMSKVHARLEWTVTGWTITDLDSTNGVTLLADDGSRRRLASGDTAAATNRFSLGDAVIELRPVSAG